MRRRNERSTRVRMKERGMSKMRMARVKVWTQSAITESDTHVLNHALNHSALNQLCTRLRYQTCSFPSHQILIRHLYVADIEADHNF